MTVNVHAGIQVLLILAQFILPAFVHLGTEQDRAIVLSIAALQAYFGVSNHILSKQDVESDSKEQK